MQNERANLFRKPVLLPGAFTISSHATICIASFLHSLDGISGCLWCVVSHMSGPRSLARSSRGGSCRTFNRTPRGGMRLNTRCTRLANSDLPTRPCPRCFNRPPRPVVIWVLLDEKRQYVLRAICGPSYEQTMPMQVKLTSTMNRLESIVSHQSSLLCPIRIILHGCSINTPKVVLYRAVCGTK